MVALWKWISYLSESWRPFSLKVIARKEVHFPKLHTSYHDISFI
jgi:hypothetical protein